MSKAEHVRWVRQLILDLSTDLQGDWGRKLAGKIGTALKESLFATFACKMPVHPAKKLAAGSVAQILTALAVQFQAGLTSASQKDLVRQLLDLLDQLVGSGKPEPTAKRLTTKAAMEAVESWAMWVSEELTNEYLEVLSANPGSAPQMIIEGIQPKPRPRKPR